MSTTSLNRDLGFVRGPLGNKGVRLIRGVCAIFDRFKGTLDGTVSETSNVPVPKAYVSDMCLRNAPLNTQDGSQRIIISPGCVRDTTDIYSIQTTADLDVNLAGGEGPNALDTSTGPEDDTWYAVFVIADSAGVNAPAGLFSKSESPVLPTAYDVFRRLGWARTDGSSEFLQFRMSCCDRCRTVWYDESRTVLEVFSESSLATASYMAIAMNTRQPPTSTTIYLNIQLTNKDVLEQGVHRITVGFVAGDSHLTGLNPEDGTVVLCLQADDANPEGSDVAGSVCTTACMCTSDDQEVQYQASTSAGDAELRIGVYGYVDSI